MWPWEHLAVGYLAYSLFARATSGRKPTAGAAIAVAIGTQWPDLLDKPFGWGTTLVPSGQSLGHSLVVAVPTVAVVLALGAVLARIDVATAFAIGYLSHLPGDVVYPVLLGGDLNYSFLGWPFLPPSGSHPVDILAHVRRLFGEFLSIVLTPQGALYLLFEGGLLLAALAVWILDGTPGLPRRWWGHRRDRS